MASPTAAPVGLVPLRDRRWNVAGVRLEPMAGAIEAPVRIVFDDEYGSPQHADPVLLLDRPGVRIAVLADLVGDEGFVGMGVEQLPDRTLDAAAPRLIDPWFRS